jgi:hypothetical protein
VKKNVVLFTSSQHLVSRAKVKTIPYYQELRMGYLLPVRNRNRKAGGQK